MKKARILIVFCILLAVLFPASALAEDGEWNTVGDKGFSSGSTYCTRVFVDGGTPNPRTGDTSNSLLGVWIMSAILAAGCLLFTWRKAKLK